MGDRLREKTRRYEQLLADALDDAAVRRPSSDERVAVAEAHVEMAEAYLEDGRHFQSEEDYVNALAAYSYGHGWLDAAIRAGFVAATSGDIDDGPGGV